MAVQRSPVRLAAADVVRAHQRRHPAEPGCCCSWRPTPGGPGWGEHVTERLDGAGLLAGDLHTAADAGTACDVDGLAAGTASRPTVLLTAVLTAALTATAVAAWAHR